MNDESIVILKAKDLRDIIREELRATRPPDTDFEKDKINRTQAAKLAGISLPTLRNYIKNGIITEHGHGRKTYFFRSEIIAALKKAAENE